MAHLVNPEVLGTAGRRGDGDRDTANALAGGLLRRAVINALLVVGALLWGLRIAGILP